MKVLRTVSEMRTFRESLSLPSDGVLGFVPTMGGLHAGHESLILSSAEKDSVTIVSLFVNPAQFAPTEDLASYPRTEEGDLAICEAAGTDVVFAPSAPEVYPEDFGTWVTTEVGQAERNEFSEGASRPTFFRGVATVLTKLFTLIRPHRTYFGQKDAQQCAVVRQLVRDMWMPIDVVIVPTVRESDGLAMSSRNAYLTSEERKHAPVVYEALVAAQAAVREGLRDAEGIKAVIRNHVEQAMAGVTTVQFDLMYVSVCDRDTMEEISQSIAPEEASLACAAAILGKARLIDNVVLKTGG